MNSPARSASRESETPSQLLASWNERLLRRQAEVARLAAAELEQFGPASRLVEACRHAVLNTPSNRVRAILALGMAETAGVGADVGLSAAGIEFVVSAAKAVDDFPSMDDSTSRGGVSSVCAAFGLGTGLLASYALIAAAYRCFVENSIRIASTSLPHAKEMNQRLPLALSALSDSIGARGAALGQLRDLSNEPTANEEELMGVIDLKTANLYVMAATAGWTLGGGDLGRLPDVGAAARHLGRAMQIKDDIEDAEMDAAAGRRCNYAHERGVEVAALRLSTEIAAYEDRVLGLGVERGTLSCLALPPRLQLHASKYSAAADC